MAYLMEQRFPFATHGRTDWSRDHPYFDYDNGAPAEVIRDRILQVLTGDPGIDGIIVGSTVARMAAVVAADVFESAVLMQGRQIDVFGKEAMPFRSLFRKELLSMPEAVKRAGRFLARAALQAIQSPELPPLQELEVPVESAFE